MTSRNSFNLDSAMEAFFVESKELLEAMEAALLQIEKANYDDDTINSIFRAAHTIKGSSGMFGLEAIESFTHVLENILDAVRNNTIEIDNRLISILLDCVDHIGILLEESENSSDHSISQQRQEISDDLLTQLQTHVQSTSSVEENTPVQTEEEPQDPLDIVIPEITTENVLNDCWHISSRFQKNCFRNSLDPLSVINYLNDLGRIISIAAIKESIPFLQDLNAEDCHLGLEINFKTEANKEQIVDSFEFFCDDCTLRVLPPNSNINEYVQLIKDLPERSYMLGEILLEIGSLTLNELDDAINIQMTEILEKKEKDDITPIGEILVENQMVQKTIVEAALEKQSKSKKTNTIRIDADKLDKVINLVGELVISGATIKEFSENEETDRNTINKSFSIMSRLIEDIRDNTMNMRMVQIGETFRRFERIIRDLSKERQKEIDLIIKGGDTELDRNLIEKITDPLMHLVRNAIDHGIDTPDEREKREKKRKGTITLNAYNEAGNIVIEVIDDGNGLNKQKIYDKAVKSGLLEEDTVISDQELYQFIFDAGFSTADKVTNISGRGVGMDVVKRNIENLRGTIILNSNEGEGTSIKINLPLTLAIIDGFMVKVSESYYIVPLNLVLECTEVTTETLNEKDGGNYIDLRGEALPFMKLRSFFGANDDEPHLQDIIIVDHKGSKAGIVVDELIGEFQTVIKPLGEFFNSLKWISGGTILGNGDVAVILDIPKLLLHLEISRTPQHT